MRIVGGELGGRLLRAPAERARPTQEKVRAAVFSALAAYVPGTRVLDLFAGSGAMGLEAWSRGAAYVEWVENAPAVLRVLRRNLADLGAPGEFRVRAADAMRWLEGRAVGAFDLVMADPPYREGTEGGYAGRIAGLLAANGWVREGGIFVYETEGREEPPEAEGWTLVRDRRYGKTRVWIWRRG